MEFDSDLSKLQGALVSLGSQNLLNSSASIEAVVNLLQEIIQNLSENGKSKATFFMVLNTELSVSEELKNDENIGLFVHITPIIQKTYLIDYIYELKLQRYLNSIIENCPCALTVELIDVIVNKLQQPSFHKTEYGIEHVYQLWCSIFLKVYKIELEFSENHEKLVAHFKGMFELIKKIIITSMKVGGDKLEQFIGNHLYQLFSSIYFCLDLLKNNQIDEPSLEIYKLSISFAEAVESNEKQSKGCIESVLENLPEVLEFLTVDLWMSLSEYCYNDSTLQEGIGNCIYNIYEAVKEFKLSPDVLSCLSVLKIKPKLEADRIAEASLDEIIAEVEKGKAGWFKALVRNSFDDKSVKCIVKNLHLAEDEDVVIILETALSCIKKDEKCSGTIKLFLKTVKLLPESEYSLWLGKVFDNYETDYLYNEDTNNDLVELFNKISEEADDSELVCLCMQSPLETIKKICSIAVYSRKQIEFSVRILKILEIPCRIIHKDTEGFRLLDYVLLKGIISDELSDKEKQGLILLVERLGKEKIIGSEFSNLLLKLIKESLENEEFEKAVLYLEMLKTLDSLLDNFALLVFMAEVLGHLSWDLMNFSTIKANGRDIADDIVAATVKKLKEECCELDWVRHELSKYWEMDQVYFCDLWFQFGKKWTGSGKFHSMILALAHSQHEVEIFKELQPTLDTRTSIVLSLTMVLPCLTFRKWNSLYNRLINIYTEKNDAAYNVLDMFASSLYLFTLNLKQNSDLFQCYEHCIRCFGRLLKSSFPKMSSETMTRMFQKILFVLDAIEEKGEWKSCFGILSPLLLESIDWMIKKDKDKLFWKEIENVLTGLEEKDFLEAARKRMSE